MKAVKAGTARDLTRTRESDRLRRPADFISPFARLLKCSPAHKDALASLRCQAHLRDARALDH